MTTIAIPGMAVAYRPLLLCVSRASTGLSKHRVSRKNLLLSHTDLQHLLDQLFHWFGWGMFQNKTPEQGVFPQKSNAQPADLKEQRWGKYRDGVVKRLEVLADKQWTLVYTDGSAKQVRGWWQAGIGAWFGGSHERNVGLPLLEAETECQQGGAVRGVVCVTTPPGRRKDGGRAGLRVCVQGDH